MANLNGLPNASVEYLPNLVTSEIPLIKTNPEENSDGDSALVGIIEHNRNRSENLQELNANTSTVTSFDDILRDIIETSKNHIINQIQQPMAQTIDNTIPSFYPTGNFYQNFANFSGGFPNFCPPFSQSMNFYSPNYNSMNTNSTNNNSYDNYETLIETIYEDATENENLSREMNDSSILENNVVNNDHTINANNVNSIPTHDQSEHQQINHQILHSGEESMLSSLQSQISQSKLQATLPYANQPVQQQLLSNSLDIPILPPGSMTAIPSQQLKYSNDTKVFCPKILSLDNRTIFNQVNSTALTPRTYTNTMPPPFSISNTSAFNSYRKRGQKRVFTNEYINVNKMPSIQQTESNPDTIVFQIKQEPCNVFIVNEETISSGQPEWMIEKSYVTSDMICLKPPMQTKRTVERAKEVAINDLFAIDFSSLDTSNIVIPTIQIKGPLHKKRKQDLKNLVSLEYSDFDETIYIEDINNNIIQSFDIKIISNSDEKENPEQSDLPNKVKNKSAINNSDTDDEIETHLQTILSPLNQTHDTITSDTNEKSITEDEICKSKNEEKFLRISESGGFNEDDVSEVGSLEEEILQVKSLKCDICNKIFKSRNTLTRHKKKCHSGLTTVKKEKKENPVIVNSKEIISNSLKEETITPAITTKNKDEKLNPEPTVEMKQNDNVEEKVDTENNSNGKSFEPPEKLKKDFKKNEQKSFVNHTNIKKQLISEKRAERKVMKRRKSTSIAVEDAENDKMKSNDEKRKRRTRSNIVSYKE